MDAHPEHRTSGNMTDPDRRDETCGRHGPYLATRRISGGWSGCPSCDLEERAGEDARQREFAANYAEFNRRARRARSCIGPRFLTCSFDEFATPAAAHVKALEAARRFADAIVEGRAGALWLLGPPGVGKTMLASCIALAVIDQTPDLEARVLSASAIVRRIRNTWDRSAEVTEAAAIADLVDAAVLCVDEVGVGASTESAAATLFDVIDARYARRAPIVLTSNLTAEEIRAAVGDRTYDRLRDGARVMVIPGPSFRGRAA